MRLRLAIMGGVALMLAGCGGDTGGNAAGAAPDTSATAAPEAPAEIAQSPECAKVPAFVPIYTGAKVQFCTSGAGATLNHESGTLVFATTATADALKAWYKARAKEKGLADNLEGPTMYAARDGTRRSFMMMAEVDGTGTKVTLNWGRDL